MKFCLRIPTPRPTRVETNVLTHSKDSHAFTREGENVGLENRQTQL